MFYLNSLVVFIVSRIKGKLETTEKQGRGGGIKIMPRRDLNKETDNLSLSQLSKEDIGVPSHP